MAINAACTNVACQALSSTGYNAIVINPYRATEDLVMFNNNGKAGNIKRYLS